MTRNGIVLSIVLLLLAAAYWVWFTPRKQTIQIISQIRPMRSTGPQRKPSAEPVYPVSFMFNGKYQFTSVKVVAADDLASNKYPVALWHLISDSNSVPIKSMVYGYPIKGMKPAVTRAKPEPLQPDVKYVLLLETDSLKASTNFHTTSVAAPAN
jgi:hypothetical protein